jgi:hypothetical protein
MRRRLRRQRQMREALLLDLGALVFELHRHGRREPELLQAKAAELTAVDEEVRALADALGSDNTVMQLVATGIAGSCENCGSLMSVDARYCPSCGAPALEALAAEGATAERVALETAPVEETTDHGPRTTEEETPAPSPQTPDPSPQTPEEAVVEEEALVEEEIPLDEEAPAEEKPAEEEPAEEPIAYEEPDETEASDGRPVVDEPEAPWGAPMPDESTVSAGPSAQGDEPPRALADDALDTAAKAIRSSLARGRDWLRGRKPEE